MQNVVVDCKAEPNFAEFGNLQHETTVVFESTVHNVVIHCQDAELDTLQLQRESDIVSEAEPMDSNLSVSDLSSLIISKPKKILDRTTESADYLKQEPQSVDDFLDSSSIIESESIGELNSSLNSMKMLDCTVTLVDCLKRKPPSSRYGSGGSFSSIIPRTTDELKSMELLGHTAQPIDVTKLCQICNRTISSASKMLHHVPEYSGPGYACPVEKCNFIFTHKSNFDKHVKCHTGIIYGIHFVNVVKRHN